MGIEWYGTEIVATLDRQTMNGCLAAAEHLRDAMIVKVSEVYPPASDPGKPPHLRSGDLQESLGIQPISRGYSVGSADPKAIWLEIGTRKMAARPFMTVTAMEEMNEMARLVAEASANGKAPAAAAHRASVVERVRHVFRGATGRAARAIHAAQRVVSQGRAAANA